jgi:hypothetical protein
MAERPRPVLVAALALIFGFYLLFLASIVALMIAMHSAAHPRVMTAAQELPQSDFAMFWYSGKLLLMNFANAHGGHAAPDAWETDTFRLSLVTPTPAFHLNWMYPPPMGLLAMLYSSLPLALSFWVFRVVFLLGSAILLRAAGLGWGAIIMGLASPAGLLDMLGGQNGTLTGGIAVAALLLMDSRPGRGGVLAGLLCIKPQIGLMLPLILFRRGRLKALLFCVACVAVIGLLTLPIEGWQSWVWFFTSSLYKPAQFIAVPFHQVFPAAGVTVFFMARSLHAGVRAAWAVQAVSSCIAAFLIWRQWRLPAQDPVRRMALTLCLWILLTPYGYIYDLAGFSVGMAAMFMRAPDRQKPVFGLLWLLGGYTGTLAKLTGCVLMPIAAIAGVLLLYGGANWLDSTRSGRPPPEDLPAANPLPL